MLPSLALAGAALLLSLSSPARSAAIPSYDSDARDHVSRSELPGRWFHDDGHFAHALFKRQATNASGALEVGSPAWTSQYPAGVPDSNAMPQAWKDALAAAVQAGKIPNIPVPVAATPADAPVYPAGTSGSDPSVCSFAFGCVGPNVIINAPAGVLALSFDDGPLPVSYSFFLLSRILIALLHCRTGSIRHPQHIS